MRQNLAIAGFALLLFLYAVVAYAWWPHTPEVMASHWGAGGVADGWMDRSSFFGVFTLVGVGSALSVALPGFLIHRFPDRLVNIPHREHWLSPERREATLADMRTRLVEFANVTLVGLVALLHVVCQVNLDTDPRLPTAFLPAFVGYMLFTLVWVLLFMRRFRRT